MVEIVGGYFFDSLALLADATHMTSDVLALTLALIALILAQRPPTERHTFGFERTEVLDDRPHRQQHAVRLGGQSWSRQCTGSNIRSRSTRRAC